MYKRTQTKNSIPSVWRGTVAILAGIARLQVVKDLSFLLVAKPQNMWPGKPLALLYPGQPKLLFNAP
jgi:hypothetical protein